MSAIGDVCAPDCTVLVPNLKVRGVKLGKGVQERLQSDIEVHEESLRAKERDWTKKFDCTDEMHTKNFRLTIKEAELLLQPLEEFARGGNEVACPSYRSKVLNCLQDHKEDSFNCNRVVERFSQCVDDLMMENSRNHYGNSKKPTYTQKYQHLREEM